MESEYTEHEGTGEAGEGLEVKEGETGEIAQEGDTQAPDLEAENEGEEETSA